MRASAFRLSANTVALSRARNASRHAAATANNATSAPRHRRDAAWGGGGGGGAAVRGRRGITRGEVSGAEGRAMRASRLYTDDAGGRPGAPGRPRCATRGLLQQRHARERHALSEPRAHEI